MSLDDLWRLLHLFFAFTFVGALAVAEWNSRAARKTAGWPQRATLWDTVRISSLTAGLFGLLLLGVFGNLSAMAAHYDPGSSTWMQVVNGLWFATLVVYAALCVPGAARLARIARDTAGGGPTEGYDPAARRWRMANALVTLLYIALLVLMVVRWGP